MTDPNPFNVPDDVTFMNPEEAYKEGVSAGWDAGYIQGLVAASNAAAVEHTSLGREGAVAAIEKRLVAARGSSEHG